MSSDESADDPFGIRKPAGLNWVAIVVGFGVDVGGSFAASFAMGIVFAAYLLAQGRMAPFREILHSALMGACSLFSGFIFAVIQSVAGGYVLLSVCLTIPVAMTGGWIATRYNRSKFRPPAPEDLV